MSKSPEFQAPPEIYYNDTEDQKYTSSAQMVQTQWKFLVRALELLGLPYHGLPHFLLDTSNNNIYLYFFFLKADLDFVYSSLSSSPEFQAPTEIYYNNTEARKYTSSSNMVHTQRKLSEGALELLGLPHHGLPRLLFYIGCGSGVNGETLSENGQQWTGLDISSSMLSILVILALEFRKIMERALEVRGLSYHGLPHTLLDVGCVSGISWETLSENGQQWISLDILSSMFSIFIFWWRFSKSALKLLGGGSGLSWETLSENGQQ
ncbi:hypothetical protein GIB67_028999 [Kingdonia uniflora]|uniref:Methyltransferase type 11 domain-containing protein n=1 Tax=Kingdonia uniflora TaxID=39325 RepID=A0A7J7N6S2_9MAGN|nr:hypothetical protein GIB67_028999 [Kingdonia uniflora]